MDKPRIDTGLVYTTVADTLPQEGRDFTLDAAYDKDKQPKLVVTALTDLGKAWVPFLEENLTAQLKARGVALGTTDQQPAETITAETVRAKVEAEAKAAFEKKIAATEAEAKAASAKLEGLRKAQASGTAGATNAAVNKEILDVRRKVDEAVAHAAHLRKVLKQVETTRVRVDARAREVALADKKAGKDWSFDLKAPLGSLFERQDITQKLKSKESLVGMIAEHEVAVAELTERAIHVAKQYSLQKENK